MVFDDDVNVITYVTLACVKQDETIEFYFIYFITLRIFFYKFFVWVQFNIMP